MAKSFDELLKRTTTRAVREKAESRGRELLAEMLLSQVRILAGMSQRELAAVLGIKQPTLSKLERQDDMQISTLKRIVEALGGELHVIAKLPRGAVRVRQFDRSRKKESLSQFRELELV